MKIRTSFVTNSSSSSFIISYKPKKYTSEEIEKYPELVMISDFVKTMVVGADTDNNDCEATEQGIWIADKEDLWKYYLLNSYDKKAMMKFKNLDDYYASLEDYDYHKGLYEKVMPILEKGEIAIVRQVSYHDDTLRALFSELESLGVIHIVDAEW